MLEEQMQIHLKKDVAVGISVSEHTAVSGAPVNIARL